MDELVGPSLIQGDQLDIPDENEADTLNDETFGDFEEGWIIFNQWGSNR